MTSAQSVGCANTGSSLSADVVATLALLPSPPHAPTAASSMLGAERLDKARHLLKASAREMLAEIERLGKVASSSDGHVVQLESQLAEAHEDL